MTFDGNGVLYSNEGNTMNERQLIRTSIACATLISLLVLTALLRPGIDEDTEAQRQHCAMVKLWEDSNGEYGWPDYNNTAHMCKEK